MISKACVVLATAVAVSACGSSDKPTDAQQIKAVSHSYVAAIKKDAAGPACRLTSDQQGCLEAIATARALGVKASDTLSGKEGANIDNAKITVEGDQARDSRGTRFVRRDGKWLLVLKKS